MSPLARVHVERAEDLVIAAVAGEVDASNAAEIGDQLRGLMTNTSHGLIVDLTETTYLDSAGVNLLFALAGDLDHRQQRLRLVVPPASQIARLMRMVAIESVAPMHPTRAAALEQEP